MTKRENEFLPIKFIYSHNYYSHEFRQKCQYTFLRQKIYTFLRQKIFTLFYKYNLASLFYKYNLA